MNEAYMILILVAALSVLTLVIGKLAFFFQRFAAETKYLCYEMEHAEGYREYRHWRRRLRYHYLTLIPFVNEKNAASVYSLLYKGKYAKKKEKKERKDSLTPLLAPSLIGICACLVCVCGMTWAWYTANVQTNVQQMTGAYYEVTVVSLADSFGAAIQCTNGSYNLTTENEYTITLLASGTVKNCGGYCLIQSGEWKYYTQTFGPGEEILITLTPDQNGGYTFTGVWGSLPSDVEFIRQVSEGSPVDNSGLANEDSQMSAASNDPESQNPDSTSNANGEITYTVQSGDTLSKIADQYNTTADKLAAYNGIADKNKIQAGQELKIPPDDYVIPEVSVSTETTPEETEPSTTEPAEAAATDTSETTGTEPASESEPNTSAEPQEPAETESTTDPESGV